MGRRKSDGFDWDCLAKPFWGLVKMAVAIVALCFVFTHRDKVWQFLSNAEKVVVSPPISASFRESLLGKGDGYVMTIANMAADKSVMVEVYREKLRERTPKFLIKPNDDKEFGSWQIGTNFTNGERGYISVEGYGRKLYYRIEGERYKTWFDE